MPATQTTAPFDTATNPLVNLSPAALRLYGALEVFRESYRSPRKKDWFYTPQLDQRLQQIGFSQHEVEKGFSELLRAGLLQVEKELDISWYRLK